MAKEHTRSNREVRKPKTKKLTAAPVRAAVSMAPAPVKAAFGPNQTPKKKG